MNSIKGVFAGLVLLFGFLLATGLTHAGERKAFAVDGGKRIITTAVVKAQRANAANSFGAGTPEDSSPSPVAYFDSEKVAAAIAKGGVLSDWTGEKNYRVAINRVEKPAVPEIHNLTTHIFYVLEGTATYVTGGSLVDAKTTAPNEIRGTAIEGGETRHLSKGDVIVVPHGVPHWYKEVQSPFILYVVNFR